MSKLMADQFTNLYSVSKTLRFQLRPQGRTLEHIEKKGVISTDVHRAESYTKVKKLIDDYHREFIEEVLSELELTGLDEYARLYYIGKRSEKEEKALKDIQSKLRKQIVAGFKANKKYTTLFKKELIKVDLIQYTKTDEEKQELLKEFKDFTTYFDGFYTNRANMYSEEEKSTAISYRIIHQNLPKYLDNAKIFKGMKDTNLSEDIEELKLNLDKKASIQDLNEYFEVDGFNKVLSQKGIDQYNLILGGFAEENGEKIKGLNEYINLFNQKKTGKFPKLKQLFKQILSDSEKMSFVLTPFETDEEMLSAVEEAVEYLMLSVIDSDNGMSIGNMLSSFANYDTSKIYLQNDAMIQTISQQVLGDWSIISKCIEAEYDKYATSKKKFTEKYIEKRKNDLKAVKHYSFDEINAYVKEHAQIEFEIANYYEEKVKEQIKLITDAYDKYEEVIKSKTVLSKEKKEREDEIAVIKKLLDAFKELQHFLKSLVVDGEESDKDEFFYGTYMELWENLGIITLLYNKVRNFITKKPYSIEKVKLNFFRSTLMHGWDKNKERDNLAAIFIKDGMYYLGIMSTDSNKVLENTADAKSDNVYQKMEYKLLPGPNKMLPKVFFSKSRIDEFAPTPEILANYKKGTHKKGDNFNLEDCHKLIDFFKASINKHEDWSKFDFKFSDTSSYEDISGFYREVEQQGYKITYKDIDADYIDQLVEEGKLYLFQIYNKDFSEYSKGTPNLHTIYWKSVFSPENLADVVYKLNGEAEIFYRKASLPKTVTHVKNEKIKNKNPDAVKKYSCFEYDLIKNKRFTCDQFLFHAPITMNFKAVEERYINRKVNLAIRDAEDLHVIGIDRGERNLLYISVIDMNGKIKEQMSLNEILFKTDKYEIKTDYHKLLSMKEAENDKARQSWTSISNIKELKEGYLSQVVSIITKLMIKYNAIIVLEDLNFGFKRGRQKVEKQVYQKFEKMLIDKLNYYVDKQKNADEPGGAMNAYQLTDQFDSFQKLGKQSGFLYYVPAWNTSKIDPTTGFTNLFYTKYESVQKTKEFIGKFKDIYYDAENNRFAFEFDYKDFTYKADGTQTEWTVYSHGERIDTFKNKMGVFCEEIVEPTQLFKELFEEFNVNLNQKSLIDSMLMLDSAEFFKRFMKVFSLVLKMRNSISNTNVDYMISPVINARGTYYISGTDESLPLDADANGAYNIAKKGLWIIDLIKKTDIEKLDKIKLAISNKEWLKYAQENVL